jgi:hypothetical protein
MTIQLLFIKEILMQNAALSTMLSRRQFLVASGATVATVTLFNNRFAQAAPLPQGGVSSLPLALSRGVYTIQQKSNGRFVDAHEVQDQDFSLVTRPPQYNDSQRWLIGRYARSERPGP